MVCARCKEWRTEKRGDTCYDELSHDDHLSECGRILLGEDLSCNCRDSFRREPD